MLETRSDGFKPRRITPAWKGSQQMDAGRGLELAGYEQFGDGDDELGGSRGTIDEFTPEY